jgi:hypothetical protein
MGAPDSVVVTHPFHPLAGERLEVVGRARRGGVPHLRCVGGGSGTVTLPAGWTDGADLPAGTRLTYELLVELADTVTAIRDTPTRGR